MDGTYYVVVWNDTGKNVAKSGLSSAPHLYTSRKKAEAASNRLGYRNKTRVVPVQLTELKQGVTA